MCKRDFRQHSCFCFIPLITYLIYWIHIVLRLYLFHWKCSYSPKYILNWVCTYSTENVPIPGNAYCTENLSIPLNTYCTENVPIPLNTYCSQNVPILLNTYCNEMYLFHLYRPRQVSRGSAHLCCLPVLSPPFLVCRSQVCAMNPLFGEGRKGLPCRHPRAPLLRCL